MLENWSLRASACARVKPCVFKQEHDDMGHHRGLSVPLQSELHSPTSFPIGRTVRNRATALTFSLTVPRVPVRHFWDGTPGDSSADAAALAELLPATLTWLPLQEHALCTDEALAIPRRSGDDTARAARLASWGCVRVLPRWPPGDDTKLRGTTSYPSSLDHGASTSTDLVISPIFHASVFASQLYCTR